MRKILVANRGEIARRIIRTLREMGITSVAVYSDVDREAPHVWESDVAYRIGPPPAPESYLNVEELIRVGLDSGSDGIHPGYGFLAENAAFAERVASAGLTFIGPSPEAIRRMGNKIEARETAASVEVPVVPGTSRAVTSLSEAERFAREHGLPVLIKAGGGGGGRGIRLVESAEQVAESLDRAAREAETYFHNAEVYLERYFPRARHIEVQVSGDIEGTVVAWGERDCSVQRRRQKLIEETPAPGLPPSDRGHLLEAARACAASIGYVGVGTVEFLYIEPGQFYFLEMNTRIQVEHTVTEQVTGLDLVRESIRLASGGPAETRIEARGHAIEARINAEDPARNFAPGPGLITRYVEPGGPGVRVDSGVYQGFVMPGSYDSLMSKVIAWDVDRERTRLRLLRALREYRIEGVPTTIPLIETVLRSDALREAKVTTTWLDDHLQGMVGSPQPEPEAADGLTEARRFDVEVNGKRFLVRLHEDIPPSKTKRGRVTGPSRAASVSSSNRITSRMHGTVVAIRKQPGDEVDAGETVFVVEAMKMENELAAPRAGTISSIAVSVGDTVEVDQVLAEMAAE
ncbi:MAG TPA: biotin carboxylase N-terminal domain-containing protein [Chloroflexota bacterium]|nr:biotin carboxylase N-terminal domain-containing protein [Chloroflexota bacterium]